MLTARAIPKSMTLGPSGPSRTSALEIPVHHLPPDGSRPARSPCRLPAGPGHRPCAALSLDHVADRAAVNVLADHIRDIAPDPGLQDLCGTERGHFPGHGQLAEQERLIYLAVQNLDRDELAGRAAAEIDPSLPPAPRRPVNSYDPSHDGSPGRSAAAVIRIPTEPECPYAAEATTRTVAQQAPNTPAARP